MKNYGLVLVFIVAAFISCGSKKEKAASEEVKSSVQDTLSYNKTIYFLKDSCTIQLRGDNLAFIFYGLNNHQDTVIHNIEGTSIVNCESEDLNNDSYPEFLCYLVYDGSGSYGTLIGYSSNKGLSMSEFVLPELKDEKLLKGYMGHDKMIAGEATLVRMFPIYKESDCNANPTGGTRQIQYKLVEGEACRQLEIDRSLDY